MEKNNILLKIPILNRLNFGNVSARYQNWHEISVGSFGTVYRAKDVVRDIYVAIKTENNNMLIKGEKCSIKREYKKLKKFKHPNIITVYDYIESDACMIMEYMPMGDLLTWLNKNTQLSEILIKTIYKQLLSALMYIHKLKYIHGDVKLENIVLDNSQKIKLVDFGFCTSYEKLEGYHWGSLLYSAPEIILKSELITPKIDTWSGGIVLFAISFGILPIRLKMGCSFEEIKTLYNKISELGPPFSDKIPRSTALKELLKKILTIDPKLRISEEEILASDWLSGSGSLHLDLGNLSLVESPLSSASPDTPEFPKKF